MRQFRISKETHLHIRANGMIGTFDYLSAHIQLYQLIMGVSLTRIMIALVLEFIVKRNLIIVLNEFRVTKRMILSYAS